MKKALYVVFTIFFVIAVCTSIFIMSTEAEATTIPDITEPCGLTEEELQDALCDTLKPYAGTFIQAERMSDDYGKCVNAAFLAAVAQLESGNGRSKLAKNKNNLFGWKRHGEYQAFSSWEACIIITAQKIKKHYIDNGRTTIASIGERYCDEEWSEIITKMYGGMYFAN